ncbi:sel1 repeat family protein [Pseudomonas protegens]|uniref:Sel1 repeat family protein n=1 Tax=Pseudomonas protegens TaxID=380021 RepID=A0A2T6GFS2_9PSED|nr:MULTISPECIES: tetratricopeptide repeat protein [Pseudomonas]PUA43005.1 sel1 repeat family protein [Pseudomonas protegens]ULT73508.1 sel1 repeat family protein [Pseudomonas sp. BC42]
MPKQLIKVIGFCACIVLLLLNGAVAVAYPIFTCAYELDNNPPLDPQAESWFQQARTLEKTRGVKDWKKIVGLYEQAIAKDHWKAMHNLAGLYRTGWPGRPGVEQDTGKMLDLYERMVKLKVPLGYYNWSVITERGKGVLKPERMAASYLFQAAQLGSPLAQVQIGQYFAYALPRHKQDDDMAERYYRCAGAQEDSDAILKTASFYDTAKNNKPRSLFYYQRAASLGNSIGFNYLIGVFKPIPRPIHNFGYKPDEKLCALYSSLSKQLDEDPRLLFPNLMKDHPLPPHPTQGFDAEHPDRRPEL